MRPTLRQLQYLVAVAESGRFRDAAKQVHITQPGLSSQIAAMEDVLGATLFERTATGAILTPRGTEVYRRAKCILRDVEELKAFTRHEAAKLDGHFRLGVLPVVGPYLLPMAVRQLHTTYPNLRFSVREETAGKLDIHLNEGTFDTIISSQHDHPGLAYEPLFDEHLWICVAADDPLALNREPIGLEAIRGRHLLTLSGEFRLTAMVQSLSDEAGGIVSHEYEGTSLDSVRLMAEMGAGIAVLPSLYALSEVRRDPQMVIRRIDHPLAIHSVGLMWRETSPFAPSLQVLADELRQVALSLMALPSDLLESTS
ncbi:LysR family transcriptional regulator [Hyphomonas jannaschiana]|jgi:LysR family hydrogen peroxide-inducible transcriptional activator|uniref:LysR family transcriptional regulator n=1 Tax=Hyphomonas jannaschiana VP2 TaxID=1280952 RepID=A0A059FIA5_9PROT|nr:LysR family transcriptional regulator [Hyphomonas jannaschiana]KCZ90380.1 LysR family transcriptional regulator [Hyphomonas jannaschiana VP2]